MSLEEEIRKVVREEMNVLVTASGRTEDQVRKIIGKELREFCYSIARTASREALIRDSQDEAIELRSMRALEVVMMREGANMYHEWSCAKRQFSHGICNCPVRHKP